MLDLREWRRRSGEGRMRKINNNSRRVSLSPLPFHSLSSVLTPLHLLPFVSSALASKQSQTHYSHLPYTPPDLGQTSTSSSPYGSSFSSSSPLFLTLDLNRPLPNLPDSSTPIWSPCTYSPGSTEEGGDECITPTQQTGDATRRSDQGDARMKKREGSAVWDPILLNGYFQIQREKVV